MGRIVIDKFIEMSKNIQEFVANHVIDYLEERERWVIVKVDHGNLEKIHIEYRNSKSEMLKRVENLIGMVKEQEDENKIKEELRVDRQGQYHDWQDDWWWWWWCKFEDGLLVTIDATLIK